MINDEQEPYEPVYDTEAQIIHVNYSYATDIELAYRPDEGENIENKSIRNMGYERP